MNKLTYPEQGLTSQTQNILNDCTILLNEIIAECNFDMPDNFNRQDYLVSFPDKIRGYKKEVEEIQQEIADIDNSYRELSEEANRQIANLEDVKISEFNSLIR